MKCRTQSPLEERVNVVTHAFGLVASVAALPALIALAMQRGDALSVAGAGVFGLALVSTYGASTMYHAARPGPAKEFWLRVDYAAVYLLIAGTYTPFSLGVLRGPLGITLLTIVWAGALAGMYMKVRLGSRYVLLSNLSYLGLGWLALIAAGPLLRAIGWDGFWWILAGGVIYTIGVIVLACQHRLRYCHCAWHLFVLGGSVCHVVAVTGYGILPPQ